MEFESAGKLIRLYGTEKGSPLIIMNTAGTESSAVFECAKKLTASPFTLASVSGIKWNDEMTPWPSPPVSSWDTPYSGLADKYLTQLEETIIPEIISRLGAEPEYIAAAGYSLGGLFALYVLFRSDIFSRAASISGSLWYPGFADFTESHETAGKVEGVYLSLGDREDKGGSRIMRTVGESTARVERALREKGINTAYEMNKGGHFSDPEGRLAKGIAWVIAQGVAR